MKKSVVIICLMMVSTMAMAQDWNTDLGVAKKKALAENKNILLVFSGSDWCTPCIYMDKEVWPSKEFKLAADKSWVLLRADFLQKKGNPEPVNVNDMKMILAEKYNRDGFFPFFVMLDKNGKVLSKSGYEDLETAGEYVTLFKKMAK
ncbi:thioredoxin family protein [Flavobacterium sp. DG1-102-2]|uniref:thioredoxin family protein n=1 Tax=Flavobacterium sp. DG1-102-2 TaxID=3081663 RepID=UPI00294A8602|nr:thioredoxin family protein [Flavobacterium sp. DG1-102-2]MDV6170053.1 thioredoxin family protein [Flavobacterium sp. DG1-102-2]